MDEFRRFAAAVSHWAGHPFVFSGAVALLIIWGALGPAMGYSTAWFYLLFLPTGISTFLMTFIIANTQNRDSVSIHVKLDELIRAVAGARNTMINVEELNDEELTDLREKLVKLAERARDGGEPVVEDT